MAHESLVYGFIASTRRCDAHDFRLRNQQILDTLPEEDDFPHLTQGMFSCAGEKVRQGTFRTPIIHFGGSMNGLMFDAVPEWIAKLEGLLSRLYWLQASAHVWTDFIDGCYQYWWLRDDNARIMASYETADPQPTSKWIRSASRFARHLDAPPSPVPWDHFEKTDTP